MHRFPRLRCALLSAALLAACPVLCAQTATEQPAQSIHRPAASQRIVRIFDFEPSPEEIFPIPRHWDMAQDGSGQVSRPGFPRFNSAEFDFARAGAGEGSVRLSAHSGSVCLRLDPGVIPVFPNTEYLISAKVRTGALHHARAAISARFLDQASTPIPGSERRSALIAGERWMLITAVLPGDIADAAFLQIDLELLQPREFQSPTLGAHHVWAQDFPASAWFDEVAVVQLPRVRLETNSPVGVITAPERPAITAAIRDLTGESMRMSITVQDAAGRTADVLDVPLTPGTEPRPWVPKLPGYGWYRATLELSTAGSRVGSTYTDFAWVPPLPSSGSEPGAFTLLLENMPPGAGPSAAALLRPLGANRVAVPVWTPTLTRESLTGSVEHVFDFLSALGPDTQVAFSLPVLPEEVAGKTRSEPGDVSGAFRSAEQLWTPYLLPLLDKFGQRVQEWHIGGPVAASTDRGGVERLRSFLTRLVPGPTLMSPVAADVLPLDTPRHEQLIHVSAAIPPAAVGELVGEPSGIRPTHLLQTLPEQFGRDQAAADLVQRIVELWAHSRRAPSAPTPRVALTQPWTWATSDRPHMPAPEYAALRTVAGQLSGMHFVCVLPAGPDIRCYLFANADQSRGTLVAWMSGPAESPSLRAYLGGGRISACDIWGNRASIPVSSDSAGPQVHQISLGSSPMFIENVDPHLCRFIADFEITPPAIPLSVGEHQVELNFTNPWPARVDGRLTILEPGGLSSGDPEARDRSWQIEPRSLPFAMAPGERVSLPVSLVFSALQDAGGKDFVVEVELNAERHYPPVRVRQRVEFAAEGIQLDLNSRRGNESGDIIIEAQVTNKSTAPMTVELSAIAPGLPRSKAFISDLEPGATATRRFVYPNAAGLLRGESVIVTAQEFQSRSRISKSIRPN